MEAVTLHRRFPYAVLAGLFFLDAGAGDDGTSRRRSTFLNTHARLKLFTGRGDPAGREEQFERFYIILTKAAPTGSSITAFAVGEPDNALSLDQRSMIF